MTKPKKRERKAFGIISKRGRFRSAYPTKYLAKHFMSNWDDCIRPVTVTITLAKPRKRKP